MRVSEKIKKIRITEKLTLLLAPIFFVGLNFSLHDVVTLRVRVLRT